jgi:hypothetical protein
MGDIGCAILFRNKNERSEFMRKQITCWIGFVAAGVLFSLPTMSQADENQPQIGSSPDNGLVVLSVTVASKLPKGLPEVHLLYRRVYSAATEILPVNYGDSFRPFLYPISVNGERLGNLAVLDLPEGNYEFYARRSAAWSAGPVISGTYPLAHWTDSSSSEHFPIRFNVAANRVTYAGNLILTVDDDGRSVVLIENKHERDIPMYLAKNPAVKPEQIRYTMMQ